MHSPWEVCKNDDPKVERELSVLTYVGICPLANVILATAAQINQALALCCAFGSCAIKCLQFTVAKYSMRKNKWGLKTVIISGKCKTVPRHLRRHYLVEL